MPGVLNLARVLKETIHAFDEGAFPQKDSAFIFSGSFFMFF